MDQKTFCYWNAGFCDFVSSIPHFELFIPFGLAVFFIFYFLILSRRS
jgi:hypothetical protein